MKDYFIKYIKSDGSTYAYDLLHAFSAESAERKARENGERFKVYEINEVEEINTLVEA